MSEFQPLTIKRTFAASPQAVWNAWTKPEQFKQWFMPAPFSVPNCDLDVRTSGAIKVDTQSPEGDIMPLTGEYTLVDEPNKLVMTNSPLDADGNKLFTVQQTVEITAEGDQTVLTVTSVVLEAGENAKQYLDGMEPGLNQALDQMNTMLAA
jgi:uncharacterized protein YndB with AHSA1/START domain